MLLQRRCKLLSAILPSTDRGTKAAIQLKKREQKIKARATQSQHRPPFYPGTYATMALVSAALRTIMATRPTISVTVRSLAVSSSRASVDGTAYKDREMAAEAKYIHERELAQLERLKKQAHDYSVEAKELRRLADLTENEHIKQFLQRNAADMDTHA
eukprot:m.477312 g.477312  ORF g.477312 m.477312 type:complete len:158 (+) comp20804_c0_seq1:1528-2001(+)